MRRLMSLVWVVMVIAAGPAAADVSYDTCADPYLVEVLPTSCLPNTTNAAIDYDVPVNCSGTYGKGLWFHYAPSQNGALVVDTLDTQPSAFDTVLSVLSGSCGSLSFICCDNDSGGGGEALLALPVTAGVDYYIVLCGYSGASGWTRMNFYAPQPPTITGFDPSSGQVGDYVTITGTNFLGVTGTTAVKFNGTPVDSIESLSKTQLRVQVPQDATTGLITVETLAGSGNSAGGFSVVPGNDHCPDAIVISSTPYTNTQDTTSATDTDDPTPSCGYNFGKGVWYAFTPPYYGAVDADTSGSDFDTVLAVYTGSCGNLTEMTCDDDGPGGPSRVGIQVTAGQTYYFLGGGYNHASATLQFNLSYLPWPAIDRFSPPSGPVGTLVTITGANFSDVAAVQFNGVASSYTVVSTEEITATVPGGATTGPISIDGMAASSDAFVVEYPPANDECDGATEITAVPYTNTLETGLASSGGDITLNCDPTAGNGVWYQYTPTSNQKVVAHTYGSSFETSLIAYIGSCETITDVMACSMSEPGSAARIEFSATSGTTYYILVAGKNGATGTLTFSLHVDQTDPHSEEWTGSSGGWDNAANWGNGQVAGPSTEVVIPPPASGSTTVTLDSSVTVNSLTLGDIPGQGSVELMIPPGVELVVTEYIVVGEGGALVVDGGSLTVVGNLENQGELVLGGQASGSGMQMAGSHLQSLSSGRLSARRMLSSRVSGGIGVMSGGLTSEMPLVNVTGGYVGQPGSNLTVVTGSPDFYGRMSVGGMANLSGSALTVQMLNAFVPPTGCQFKVLVANGITGLFSGITPSPGLNEGGYFTQTIEAASPLYWCIVSSQDTVANLPPNVGEVKQVSEAEALLGTVTLVQSAAHCFYIQDPKRIGGIRVDTAETGQMIGTRAVQVGDCLEIDGAIVTKMIGGVASERQIVARQLTRLTQAAPNSISPLGMSCSTVGGGSVPANCPGVLSGVGLNNIGLLVKILGTVTYKNGTLITVDDSRTEPDPSGQAGVMLNLPGGSPDVPVGSFIAVVGVTQGYVPAGWTANRRFICPRTASDVKVLFY